MNLTDNQQLAIAHLKYMVKKMPRNELETRLISAIEDYFKYQNSIKELSKQEAFKFLQNK